MKIENVNQLHKAMAETLKSVFISSEEKGALQPRKRFF